jgi:hypothetical protein
VCGFDRVYMLKGAYLMQVILLTKGFGLRSLGRDRYKQKAPWCISAFACIERWLIMAFSDYSCVLVTGAPAKRAVHHFCASHDPSWELRHLNRTEYHLLLVTAMPHVTVAMTCARFG